VTGRVEFEAAAARRRLQGITKVVLVGSGKGGVGKTLVSCGLALAMAHHGYRTGLFDLDVHGASVPSYLRLRPPLKSTERGLEPKKVGGVEVMSTALFTGDKPVPLKGGKKRSLVNSLFAQTNWGRLDFLVVDLPPGTGDEVLAAFALFGSKAELVLVTTPSKAAIGVVSRLRELADSERVPVRGVVVNMAYLEQGRKTVYPFGRPDADGVEKYLRAPVMIEVPLDPGVASERLSALLDKDVELSRSFRRLAGLFRV